MGMKKFIERVVGYFNLDDYEVSNKRKSVKKLLKKLKKLRLKLCQEKKQESDQKRIKELEEELSIVSLQIKKGKKLLNK